MSLGGWFFTIPANCVGDDDVAPPFSVLLRLLTDDVSVEVGDGRGLKKPSRVVCRPTPGANMANLLLKKQNKRVVYHELAARHTHTFYKVQLLTSQVRSHAPEAARRRGGR